jgi:hypothetical protein
VFSALCARESHDKSICNSVSAVASVCVRSHENEGVDDDDNDIVNDVSAPLPPAPPMSVSFIAQVRAIMLASIRSLLFKVRAITLAAVIITHVTIVSLPRLTR